MTPRFSRRTLFGIAAAGTAAAAAGASLREMRACRTKRVGASPDLTIADYVDRDGWILTPADKKSLDSPQPPTRP
jgi:hypothetical protein